LYQWDIPSSNGMAHSQYICMNGTSHVEYICINGTSLYQMGCPTAIFA
jgi:hypothetical protein